MIGKLPTLPVQGYKPQSQGTVDLVNSLKTLEQTLVDLVTSEVEPIARSPRQARRLARARSSFESGFMFLAKAVFDPDGGFGDI